MLAVWEVLWRFLFLGCISFGGPVAHIGYFHKSFVERLRWLDAASYARLVALSQFLPGPGSSQIGFAVGLRHAGFGGGIAAFVGFTLPSFCLLYLLATMAGQLDDALLQPLLHGLKLLAVVVVADATLTMFRNFCRDRYTVVLAVLMAAMLLCFPSLWSQLAGLFIAAAVGVFCAKKERPMLQKEMSRERFTRWPLLLFVVLLLGLPLFATFFEGANIIAIFYRVGSFVFGGGHVVLPLLQQSMTDALSSDQLLLGYAAAQAVPGPMFSLAAFLGAELLPSQPLVGALLATAGVFLPGLLLVLAFQQAWEGVASRPKVAGAVCGINAAVVGLLMAALYRPVFISAVLSPADMALVILGFFLLRVMKVPVVALVLAFAALGWALG